MPAPHEGDRSAVAAATLAAGLLIAQQVAGRTTRDALFLSNFDVKSLPWMMMASAVLALLGAEAMSIALARRSPFRVVPTAAGLSAVFLLLEWVLSLFTPPAAAIVLYLHVATFGGALVSGFWSLVNERFDPYTARQWVGRIGTGAAAGGLVGGALAWTSSRLLPIPPMLLALAGLQALALVALRRTGGIGGSPGGRERAPSLALPMLARVPYLRTLALVVAVGAVTDALFDFLFKAKTAEIFVGGNAMMSVFALFHTGLGLLTLLLQSTLARPALNQLGLAGTVALRPAFDLVTALLGAAVPRFATAALARGAHESLSNSLYRSGYELLYTPLAEGEKRRVKAVVDVAVDKMGTLVGGAIVAGVLALWPLGAESRLFVLAAGLAVVGLVLSRRLHVGYVQALERSLLAGRVKLDPRQIQDRTTQLTLAQTGIIERDALLSQIDALRRDPPGTAAGSGTAGSPLEEEAPAAPPKDPLLRDLEALRSGERRRVRQVLRANPEPAPVMVAALVPLLAKDEVYPEVVRALRRVASRVTGQLVDALLDSEGDSVVQRRIPRVLKACPTVRAADGLRAALDHGGFGVRAASAAALAALHEQWGDDISLPREAVLAHVRNELARPPEGERQLAHVFTLLSLALEPEPLRIAWAALRGRDRALRGTALEYLDTVLPDDIFAPLRDRCGGAEAPEGPRRTVEQVAAELRASSVNLKLEQVPWKGDGDGEEAGREEE
jgi:hypothetical protein